MQQYKQLPEQISPQWQHLMQRLEVAGEFEALRAIQCQCKATDKENTILPCELGDPLGAHWYTVTSRLIHQYKNRVLLLTTGICFSYCRYCFRRDYTAEREGFITEAELDKVCEYLKIHTEVEEILMSGGDPLTGTDQMLEHIFIRVREVRPQILIRLGTRAPIFAPERFTDSFIQLCKKYRPLWIIPHINHPVEISAKFSPESRNILSKIVDSGIGIQTQTVLLKGINDTVPILKELFHDLSVLGIKPGYLFQGDLAPGTSHFRVFLENGVILYNELKKELSGLSTPVYAVDLPGGGGKINLLQLNPNLLDVKVTKKDLAYSFIDKNKNTWTYPLEK
jgi:lysine 2,3-aminomutase